MHRPNRCLQITMIVNIFMVEKWFKFGPGQILLPSSESIVIEAGYDFDSIHLC